MSVIIIGLLDASGVVILTLPGLALELAQTGIFRVALERTDNDA